ncbi:hypothetical protein E2562_008259 [Oryza meyeriana var. granulata]|uniref:Uncharacterized protein n=1 Tax=Oryza meyeriana var. granulata TaxID=110450 RepID=A0A6G1DGQ8_9ORYZ|nr:hypothetical protein E2562_008259 [Oryza meyeriana var. granulata]
MEERTRRRDLVNAFAGCIEEERTARPEAENEMDAGIIPACHNPALSVISDVVGVAPIAGASPDSGWGLGNNGPTGQ